MTWTCKRCKKSITGAKHPYGWQGDGPDIVCFHCYWGSAADKALDAQGRLPSGHRPGSTKW